MSLKAKLAEDLKAAMRAKNTVQLDALRSIKAAITLREADSQKEVDDAGIAELVRGLRKQRVEAIEQYEQGGRSDLAEKERLEKDILEQYLPAAPDASVVESTVRAVISELGASSPKDMGRVMQAAKERLSGVDGKALSELVKRLLSGS
ncbi:MAG: GatB/YqeY domain-containing protein [Myxococcales bacterium]